VIPSNVAGGSIGTSAEGSREQRTRAGTVTSGTSAACERATVEGVRVHVFSTATRVLFFEEPRPEVPDSDYVAALDLSPDEVVELRLMADELRSDQG
jgi:hypothetical protein